MTAVIDSSALVEHLLHLPLGPQVSALLKAHSGTVNVPQLLFPETVSAIKGIERASGASPLRCGQAVNRLMRLPVHQWNLKPLTPRVWQLRHSISTYDAYYVALAERLHASLITKDARLARAIEAAGLCPVDLIQ